MVKAAWFAVFLIGIGVSAQQSTPKVGRSSSTTGKEVAAEYFTPNQNEVRSDEGASQTHGPADHYLALHLGKLLSGEAWQWGSDEKQKDSGSYTVGVTYKVQQWQLFDLNVRIDFNEYKVSRESPLKMSLMPLLVFPEATSEFPLYFGFGAGPGVFFRQVEQESQLSLDYQLLLGARFFNLGGAGGFFVESGLKNHLHLTSSGQFNGAFLALGGLFTF